MRRKLLFTVMSAGIVLAALGARPRPSKPPVVSVVAGPTFNKEVSRIFQAHCDSCHHPGDIAPFSLLTYNDARAQAESIRYMTSTHQMPPWKAVSGCGDFQDVRELSATELSLITEWVKNGAPEGNPADRPAALTFDGDWPLGAPDSVLANPAPFLPPNTTDEYRCFSLAVPQAANGEANVAAFDIRPGDREIVHHAIAYIDTTGESASRDGGNGYQCFGGPGLNSIGLSALGGWAPGARAAYLPAGVAVRLPQGSRIVLQVHYHPHNFRTSPDTTQLGLYFSHTPVRQHLGYLPVINQNFTIPAGASNYRVDGTLPFISKLPVDVHVIGVFPHMHLLGRQMKIDAQMPDGSSKCLINVADWDFNWQGMYMYKNPVALPKGTKPTVTSIYDNSAANFRNPNVPPKPVSWGEATTDEMCIGFLAYTIDSENLLTTGEADRSWAPGMMGDKPPAMR